jgi:hypothetical protein
MDIANSLFGGRRAAWHARILAGAALALVLAAPGGAFGQEPSDAPANFNERYPAEQVPAAPTPPANAPANEPANVPAKAPVNAGTTQEQTGSTQPQPQSVSRKEPSVPPKQQAVSHKGHAAQAREQSASSEEVTIETTGQVTRKTRGRSRIVVERRSFLDAGTEVRPGDRKFLDYAFPPLHQPMDVVTNTGGRTGWHNWPLPGPLFPSAPQN